MADDKPKPEHPPVDTPKADSGREVTHQMILGGFTLIRDGNLMAVASPAACYDNMSYANVQGMWRFLQQNEAIKTASQEFNKVLADELTTLGDSYGIYRGRMTRNELEDNYKLLGDLQD